MEKRLALFIDFENIARGVRQHHLEERVDLRSILAELEEQGRILIKRAYADWAWYKDYRSDLLQHGIEPIQVFAATREGWKNGADIRIAIDAMEVAFRLPDITDFVLVTGDSDFLSLVNRLRENGKTVWGVGLRTSSSQYLQKSCDHYTFYEDIADWPEEPGDGPAGRRDSRALLLYVIRRMTDRQGLPGMPPPGTPLKIGAVRAAMKRVDPSWDEHLDGFGSFLEFLGAHVDVILVGRPDELGDWFLAERGTVAESALQHILDRQAQMQAPAATASVSGEAAVDGAAAPVPAPAAAAPASVPPAYSLVGTANGQGWVQTPEQKYLGALRVRRLRHVPMETRYAIIRALFRIFDQARAAGEEISLKEAKDRLHRLYEENDPSVSWDHVNNVIYHLFWTYCFEFAEPGPSQEEIPLWDRPTVWQAGMTTPEEVIRRCDTGMVRMIAEMVGTVEPHIVVKVLGDGDEERAPYFAEICQQVNQRFAPLSRPYA